MVFALQAKDDADFLKSLVQPLEDEINVLKSQLVEALEKVNYYEEEKLKLSVPSNDVLDSLVRKFGAKASTEPTTSILLLRSVRSRPRLLDQNWLGAVLG